MKSFLDFITEAKLYGVYKTDGSGNPHAATYVHVKSFKDKKSANKYAKSPPGADYKSGTHYVKPETKRAEHHGTPY